MYLILFPDLILIFVPRRCETVDLAETAPMDTLFLVKRSTRTDIISAYNSTSRGPEIETIDFEEGKILKIDYFAESIAFFLERFFR